MKNKINVGDLIMEWKDKPDRPDRQRLCYVVKLFGPNGEGAFLCPVGEEPPHLPEEQIVWRVEDILDWKVNNEK